MKGTSLCLNTNYDVSIFWCSMAERGQCLVNLAVCLYLLFSTFIIQNLEIKWFPLEKIQTSELVFAIENYVKAI